MLLMCRLITLVEVMGLCSNPDPLRATAALDEATLFRRLLLAKTMVLWGLVTPVCVLVALINGVLTESTVSTISTIFLIVIVPWGVLPVAAWLGIA